MATTIPPPGPIPLTTRDEEDINLATVAIRDTLAASAGIYGRFLLFTWAVVIVLGFLLTALGAGRFVGWSVVLAPFAIGIHLLMVGRKLSNAASSRFGKLDLWERSRITGILKTTAAIAEAEERKKS